MPQSKTPTEFKGFDDYVEVLFAGTHKDSKGVEHTFTEADLDQMIKNTPPSTAPIVIGHPKTDAPAYGWNESFKREGGTLLAKFNQVDEGFATLVKKGSYKKRSVSVAKNGDGEYYIKHVGWLGAKPPAIAGMKDVEFNESEDDVVMEFAEAEAFSSIGYLLGTIGNVLRGLREKIIDDNGIEVANQFIPDWEIDGLTSAHERILTSLANNAELGSFNEETELQALITDLAAQYQAQIPAAPAPAAEFSERELHLQARVAELEAQARIKDCQVKVDGWTAAGKLTPALAAGAVDFMAQLDAGASFEFSEGDGQKTSNPAQWFADFVERLNPIQLGKEIADSGEGEKLVKDAATIAREAQEFSAAQAEKGIDVSIDAAVMHVVKTAAQ